MTPHSASFWPGGGRLRNALDNRETSDFNRRIVLEAIRRNDRMARADISRLTGLTPPAVGRIVARLIEEGFVVEAGRRKAEAGQPPKALALNPDAAFTVGLHLDYEGITGVLVDLAGRPRAQRTLSRDDPSPEQALADLIAMHDDLVAEAGITAGDLLGIGLVSVGPIDMASGSVQRPPYLPAWESVPLRRELSAATGLPVLLDNNATAAAVGEWWYGAAGGYDDFLYGYLGHGIGGGLFLGGRIHRGALSNAGELGHVIVAPDGPACACGSVGCLEAVASLYALKRDLGAAVAATDRLDAAVNDGDPALTAWLDKAAEYLARAVTSATNLLDLEAFVLGGRPSARVLRHLADGVRGRLHTMTMRGRLAPPAVVLGRTGPDIAALGAATLPVYGAFAPADALGERWPATRRPGARAVEAVMGVTRPGAAGCARRGGGPAQAGARHENRPSPSHNGRPGHQQERGEETS
ncbi:MAG: ROK family transcriptional regulator [Azospirillaceae bacterium]